MGASAAPRTLFLILDDDSYAFDSWFQAVIEYVDSSRAILPNQACALVQKDVPLNFTQDMAEFKSTVSSTSLSVFKPEEAPIALEAIFSAFQTQGLGYYYYLWLFTNSPTETVSGLLHDIKKYLSLTLIISEKRRPDYSVLDGLHFLSREDKSWTELVNYALDMFYRPFPIILRVGQLAQQAKLTQAPGYFHLSEVLDVLGFAPTHLLLNCVGASWHQLLPQGADTSLIDALRVGLSRENVFALVRFGSDGSIGVLSSDVGLYLMIVAPDHPLPVSWQDQLNDDLRFNAPQTLVKSATDHKVSLWAHRPERLVHLLCDYLNNLPDALPRVFSLVKTIGRAKGAYSLEALVAMSREVILRELRILPKEDPSYQSLLSAGKLLGGSRTPSPSLEIPLRSSKKMLLVAKRPWAKRWKARRKPSIQPMATEVVKKEVKSEAQVEETVVQLVEEHETPATRPTSPKEPIIKTDFVPSSQQDEPQSPSRGTVKAEPRKVERLTSPFDSEEGASVTRSPSPVDTKSPSVVEEDSAISQLLDESTETLLNNKAQEFIKETISLEQVQVAPQALAEPTKEIPHSLEEKNQEPPKELLHSFEEANQTPPKEPPHSLEEIKQEPPKGLSHNLEEIKQAELKVGSPPTLPTLKKEPSTAPAAELAADVLAEEVVADFPSATIPTEPRIEKPIKPAPNPPVNSTGTLEEPVNEPIKESPKEPLIEPATEASTRPDEGSISIEHLDTISTEVLLKNEEGPAEPLKEAISPDTKSVSKDESADSPTKGSSPIHETGRLTRSKVSLRTGPKEPSEVISAEQPAAAPPKPAKKERKLTAKAARAIEDNTEAPVAKKRATKGKAEPKLKATPPKRKNAKKKGKELQSPPELAPVPPQSEPITLAPADQSLPGSLSLTELTKLKLSTFFGKPAAAKKPIIAGPSIRPQLAMLQQRPPFAPMGSARPPFFSQPPTNLPPPQGAPGVGLPPRPMPGISPPVGGPLPASRDIKPASPPLEATPLKTTKRRGKAKKAADPEPETPAPKVPKVGAKPGPKPKATRAKKPVPPKPVPPQPIRSPSHPPEPVRAPHIEPSIPRPNLLARSKITLEDVAKPRQEHAMATYESYNFFNNSPGSAQPQHYRPEPSPYPNQQRDWAYYSSAPSTAPFLPSHPYDPGYQTSRAATPSTMSHAPILPRSSGPSTYRPPPARPPMHGWDEPSQTKSVRHSSILQSRRPSQYADLSFYDSVPRKEPTPPSHYPQIPPYTSAPSPHYPLQPRNLVHHTPPPHYPYDYGRPHQYSYQPSRAQPTNHDPMDYAQPSMRGSQRDPAPHFPLGNIPSRNTTPAAPEATQEQDTVPNKSSLKHLLN